MIKRLTSLILQLAAVGLLLATGLGFLGRLYWRLDLLSHFRLEYALAALMIALALAALRRWVTLALAALTLMINVWIMAPYYLTPRDRVSANAHSLSVVSFNVLMENRRTEDVLAYLRGRNPDIIALTEVDDFWTIKLKPLEDNYPYHYLVPSDGHAGVAIYSRLPFTGKADRLAPAGFWSVIGDLSVDDRSFKLILTHPVAPTNERSARSRDNQIKAVADLVQYSITPTLVFGDFNASPWSIAIDPLRQQTQLRDSALGFGVQPTWNAFNPLMRIPIDYVWVPPEIAVLDHRIGPALGSDHFPIEVTIALK